MKLVQKRDSNEETGGSGKETKRVGFIGAGRVGFSLGRYFVEHGLRLSGYYSRSWESAKEAAEFTGTVPFRGLAELMDCCDLLFITTSDGQIEKVWKEMQKWPSALSGKIICHCSGALSSEVFTDVQKYGAYGYSVHPLFAFSDRYHSYRRLSDAFITVEGSLERLEEVITLFASLGNKVQVIPSKKKALYHAASVFVSNHVIALVETGVRLLRECGFSQEAAEQALFPLLHNNLENLVSLGTEAALTGPVERADCVTVQAHLSSLAEEEVLLYRLLSRKLVGLAKQKNPEQDYREMEGLLK